MLSRNRGPDDRGGGDDQHRDGDGRGGGQRQGTSRTDGWCCAGTPQNSQGTNQYAGLSLAIDDDEAAPAVTLAVADGAVDEDGGTTTVTATLSHASSEATTITVTALDGAYTVGTDATIVIAAGATSNASDTAAITAVDDDVDNVGNRTVTVTATAVNSHDIGTVTGASLTLTDDEETPAVTLALSEPDTSKPDTIAESGSGNASTVTATLSGTSSEAVTLTVAAAPGAKHGGRRLHAVFCEDADHRGGCDGERRHGDGHGG